jgi:hypothetical protein
VRDLAAQVLADAQILVGAGQILRTDAQMPQPALLVEVEHHLEDQAASFHELTLIDISEIAGVEASC